MQSDKLSVEESVEYYKPDVESLAVFIPWLEAQKGKQASTVYSGEGLKEHSITFPVYDSTLMNFVKTAQASSLIDRNYVYVYSRNRIGTGRETVYSECYDQADEGSVGDSCQVYSWRHDKIHDVVRRSAEWDFFGIAAENEGNS